MFAASVSRLADGLWFVASCGMWDGFMIWLRAWLAATGLGTSAL